MRIGILSDSHDQVARTRVAVARLLEAGAQVLVHCGDLTTPEVVYELEPLPSYIVFGNCDENLQALGHAIAIVNGTCLEHGGLITLGGKTIALTHGHSRAELEQLEARQPDYLLSGHTHRMLDIRRGATRFINPGALHRAAQWTVALLDTELDQLQFLTVRDA